MIWSKSCGGTECPPPIPPPPQCNDMVEVMCFNYTSGMDYCESRSIGCPMYEDFFPNFGTYSYSSYGGYSYGGYSDGGYSYGGYSDGGYSYGGYSYGGYSYGGYSSGTPA